MRHATMKTQAEAGRILGVAIYERVEGGETQEAVAADFRISRQRVGQIVQLVEARKQTPEPVAPRRFPQSDPAYLRRRKGREPVEVLRAEHRAPHR